MFLPFVSEPNFLPIVKKNEGRAPKAVETISPIFNMASAKVCKRAKGYGIVIFVFPEQDRTIQWYFPIAADSSQFTSTTAGSREIALSRNLPLSALIKDYFIQI